MKYKHVVVFKLREELSCVPCIVASMHQHKTYMYLLLVFCPASVRVGHASPPAFE